MESDFNEAKDKLLCLKREELKRTFLILIPKLGMQDGQFS